jgi:hypothetical protein
MKREQIKNKNATVWNLFNGDCRKKLHPAG